LQVEDRGPDQAMRVTLGFPAGPAGEGQGAAVHQFPGHRHVIGRAEFQRAQESFFLRHLWCVLSSRCPAA